MAKTSTCTAEDGCTFWSDGHLCERGVRHCDQCMCKCGHRWDRAEPAVLPEVERATVIDVRPGDTVVLDFPSPLDDASKARLDAWRNENLPGVRLMLVEGGRFAGVIRHDRHGVDAAPEPKECGHTWPANGWCRVESVTRANHRCVVPASATDRRHRCGCGEQS